MAAGAPLLALDEVGPSAARRLAGALVGLPALRPYALDPDRLAAAWAEAAALPAAEARLRFAVAGGEAVAVVHGLARAAFGRGAYLRLLAVSPALASRGLGRALLADFEGAWQPAGGWFLLTGADNHRAQAFYARRGYREVGRLPGFVRPGVVEALMWRSPPGGG